MQSTHTTTKLQYISLHTLKCTAQYSLLTITYKLVLSEEHDKTKRKNLLTAKPNAGRRHFSGPGNAIIKLILWLGSETIASHLVCQNNYADAKSSTGSRAQV